MAVLPVAAYASPINAPVPTSNYVTIGGLDWAWASPCPEVEVDFFCGGMDMTYQATQGWHVASVTEVSTYIMSDLPGFLANFGTSSNFKCASAWFSTDWTHCDWFDAASGAIYNAQATNGWYYETFALRDSIPGVPVPAAGLLLVSALGGVAALRRRRRG